MIKNGLFLISIGLFIFVVGAISPDMTLRSVPLLILAVVLVALGGIVFYCGYKRDKETQKEAKQNETNEKVTQKDTTNDDNKTI